MEGGAPEKVEIIPETTEDGPRGADSAVE